MTKNSLAYLRRQSPFGLGNRILRFVWNLVYVIIFRPSPRFMRKYRNALLRLFGAKVHHSANVYPKASIWAPWNLRVGAGAAIADSVIVYNMDIIEIGDNTVISQEAYICGGTHDFKDERFRLITRKVIIKNGVWVAARAFIGPGVIIDDGAVIGACAVITKNIPRNTIWAGNPARMIGKNEQ